MAEMSLCRNFSTLNCYTIIKIYIVAQLAVPGSRSKILGGVTSSFILYERVSLWTFVRAAT